MRMMARFLVLLALLAQVCAADSRSAPLGKGEEVATDGVHGAFGGRLSVAQRAEPKTLNPVLSADTISREVIQRVNADLVHINRSTQQTEPALAKSWKLSPDGRTYTLQLRRGIRFSDGQPFDADDVIFSFQVYLDESLHSPQRDLLVVGGKPISVAKVDANTVRVTLSQPYAAAERIFDSIAMLPKHILEKPYREGHFAQAWGLTATDVVGLGPYRVKQYVAGQRLVVERNPYYWRVDSSKQRLPFIDEITFLFVGSEDAQLIRFQAGETDMITRLSAENYALLTKSAQPNSAQATDLGPSLEYNFLVFNLNDLGGRKLEAIARKQAWFGDLAFRRAVSAAIDREGLVRLVYGGHGTPLWGNVTPGNKLWINNAIPHPARSLDTARSLLRSAGFQWSADGTLTDRSGQPVEFSIATSSSNTQRLKMASVIQEDLKEIGIKVNVVPLDFRALLDRMLQTYDYEAAIMAFGGGDADPNSEMNVWTSTGGTHLWHMGETKPATDWEAELDRLMQQQMITVNYRQRKQLYDRAQQVIVTNMPFVFLAAPNILTAAKAQLMNFHPAILEHYTLWNADELSWRDAGASKH